MSARERRDPELERPASTDRGRPRWELPALLGILALWLLLRLAGIDWSLPTAARLFTYHPDEFLVVAAARRVDLLHGQLNPHFFNYGSLTIYLASLVGHPFASLMGVPPGGAFTPQALYSWHLSTRLLVALMGTATVYVGYLTGRRLWGAPGGLLAAALLGLAPLHVVHSHYATVDVPTALWVSLALYAAVRIATAPNDPTSQPPRHPDTRTPREARAGAAAEELGGPQRPNHPTTQRPILPFILAGIACGAAAATKYNAALVFVAVAAAWLLAPGRRLRHLLAALAAMVVAFALLCPGAWLYTAEFLRDVGYETGHTRTGHGLVFTNTGNGWWYHFRVNLWQSMGGFGALMCAGAVPWALFRRRPGEWVLLSFALVYFLAMGGFAVRFGRYLVPLLPPLLCLVAGVLVEGYREIVHPSERPGRRWVPLGAAALLILQLAALSAAQVLRLTGPDPRDQALEWVLARGEGRVLGLGTVPWFYSPPVSPFNGGPISAADFRANPGAWRAPLAVTEYRAEALAGPEAPGLVVLSDYEAYDPLRLAGQTVTDPGARRQVEEFGAYWSELGRRYRLAATFGEAGSPPRPGRAGRLWSHDWRYPSPTLWIWERRP